jgi:hypothetical protein
MRLIVLLAILGSGVPAAGSGSPVALTLDGATLSALADLFEQGGFGQRDEERGAFLLAGSEGPCVLWPFTATRRASSFRGTIPEGAIAIAHTHPNARPDPSAGDWQVAETLGLPVFVVTARGVRAAVPGGGKAVVVLEGRGWPGRVGDGTRCLSP